LSLFRDHSHLLVRPCMGDVFFFYTIPGSLVLSMNNSFVGGLPPVWCSQQARPVPIRPQCPFPHSNLTRRTVAFSYFFEGLQIRKNPMLAGCFRCRLPTVFPVGTYNMASAGRMFLPPSLPLWFWAGYVVCLFPCPFFCFSTWS